ncbi:hypothetical protein AB0J71_12085 [Nonomuraea sp. NPDC049637]
MVRLDGPDGPADPRRDLQHGAQSDDDTGVRIADDRSHGRSDLRHA